ncbi:NO-inducible flavohemoprotein [Halobacillus mangrovi]|uniref:NO-inducible flavohemoprotein n=1 Tax=Halobacillus mangrovi TaxID=402384 RepID=UPI003D9645F6
MLDAKTVDIVKQSAPILEEHSREIGTRFYEKLFSTAPELYNIFNQTNQRLGIQQSALAYSVYKAGENIDQLENIEEMIERVTEKHRALGVKPEQYPLVGETLLEAVKDILGDSIDKQTMSAWEEAYQAIANAFIDIESGLYKKVEEQPGGWNGVRSFYVDKKVKESDVITSFYLKPEDGKEIMVYKPGQYLTFQVEIEGDNYTHMRHYSLSDSPGKDYYRISVKREDGHEEVPPGVVSNYLHREINEGDLLNIAAPAGDFTIVTEEMPIVLISGGVGLTPMISMLNTLVKDEPGREITFIHAAEKGKVHAMSAHVKELAATYENVHSYVCYSNPSDEDLLEDDYDKKGFIDLEWLQTILGDNKKDFYFCGPIPFMKTINEALKQWEVPEEHRHYEVFSPVSKIENA